MAPRVVCALLAASFVGAHALFLAAPALLDPWQLQATDALFRLREDTGWGRPEADNTLVYIDQRDDTEEALGIAYIERGHYARLVSNLAAMNVSVQVHDTLFRARKDAVRDKELVGATGTGPVLYGFVGRLDAARTGGGTASLADPWRIRVYGDAGRLPAIVEPVSNFRALADAAAGQGFIDTDADMDGVVRRAPLLARSGDGFYPSLSFLAVCTHLGVTPDRIELRPGKSIRLRGARNGRDIVIPIDARGRMRVNFLGWEDPRQRHFTVQKVLDDRALEVLKGHLSGRVVLVADVSTAAGDLAPSPLHRNDPLPALHGNVIHTILTEQFLHELGFWAMLPFELLLLGGVYCLARLRATTPFLLGSLGLAGIYWAAATTLFCQLGVILHLVRPSMALTFAVVAALAYRFFAEQRTRAVVQATFERYFPPGVVRRLVDDPERLELGGERKELTVLFSDIVGFTSHSAEMDPEDAQAMLNRYFEAMFEIVFEHGGTLDKVIGDGLMVFFGDPEDQPDHALRCVRCAMAMQRHLRQMNREGIEQGHPRIDIRIGINTGPMIVGNMGSPRRLSYTVIGSAVNFAARLEPRGPVGGILVSESTREAVGGEIPTRPVEPFTVKGFDAAVTTFEVVLDEG